VIFCFVGSTYPAIDLGAGEKERGTLETLLATPASRLQILIGKFGVVASAGIGSAAIAMLGLIVGARTAAKLPSHVTETVMGLIEPGTILMLMSLLVPLAVFFAAGLLSISIFARSFKEAQSLMTPLSIVVIMPVVIGLMPGIKLDATTALIPVLNVSLASKDIIAGTISYGLMAEVYGSLVVLAALSLYGCARWFGRESTIFRSS
jgi:sodium transport system permease protein